MSTQQYILVSFHLFISLILIVVVLMQSGSSDGMSGAISGGAETFFGKSKGRTIDQILKRWTSIIALLFLITSVVLSFIVK